MTRAAAGTFARRPAYTLIELVVVITIIAVLAGITVAFLTAFNSSGANAAAGASVVQNTLQVARSEALRSGRPYGVRFLRDPSNPTQVTEMQYIQQPADFFGGRAYVPATNLSSVTFLETTIDLYGGFGPNDPRNPVQVGDYIELRNAGQVRRITALVNNGGVCNQVLVNTPFPFATAQSPVPATGPVPNQFRIIRQPRVIGEEPILLPTDIIVDLQTNTTYTGLGIPAPLPVNLTDNCIDVLFAPSGAVIGAGVTETPIFLWVRDGTKTLFNGDDTLLAVYPRTGLTAAHPANPAGTDPYSYARDGRSSAQ